MLTANLVTIAASATEHLPVNLLAKHTRACIAQVVFVLKHSLNCNDPSGSLGASNSAGLITVNDASLLHAWWKLWDMVH